MAPVNAIETFKALLRDDIAPRLRELGFRGSGQNYRLPNPSGHYALLNFQRSQGNSAGECSFTANVTFIRRQDWPEGTWMGAAPTGGGQYPVDGWYERVGFLRPERSDLWWVLRSESDARAVAEQVVGLVASAVLPELTRRIQDADRSAEAREMDTR